MGDLGVERSYEHFLRGEKGCEVLIRDARGQIQGRYEDGAYDKSAVPGKNIKLALNIELQQYAESLMVNKKGAIVAIEPSTGEILCMVSARPMTRRCWWGANVAKTTRRCARMSTCRCLTVR